MSNTPNETTSQEPASQESESQETASQESTTDDIRAKMREALDRKHEKERSGEAHLDGHDKAHGVHGKSGGGRDFRRKSGGGGS